MCPSAALYVTAVEEAAHCVRLAIVHELTHSGFFADTKTLCALHSHQLATTQTSVFEQHTLSLINCTIAFSSASSPAETLQLHP